MDAVVLVATHERKVDSKGREVPLPLVDLKGEPYVTTLVRKLASLPGLRGVIVVTNEKIRQDLEIWKESLPPGLPPVRVLGDGTYTPEERRGAIGDLLFAIRAGELTDDLLVVGGDNWFTYDLAEFASRARQDPPAVVVTRLPPGVSPARFGMVELGEGDRVVRFVEKPAKTDLSLRASCVYYFSAANLAWLEQFASEQPTTCTPGTFLAWLVGRTPVLGVLMTASWYDVSGSRSFELKGPDALEFRDALRKIVSPTLSTWERRTACQLQWVSSHEDLLDALHDSDPNVRIVAARLLGETGHLLTSEGRAVVAEGLLHLLADPGMNDYEYGGFQSDEDSPTYVSTTAATALARLGYARIDSAP
jgi:glucose-1-phosphate thymidylyltransferase